MHYSVAGAASLLALALTLGFADGDTSAKDISGNDDGGATMSLPASAPGTLDGVEPEAHSHFPPIVDGNGNLYRITEGAKADGGNFQKMMRSSDGGATWLEVGAGSRPTARDLEGAWQLQLGTSIFTSVSGGTNLWWSEFRTSDAAEGADTWVGSEAAELGDNPDGTKQFSSLVGTSNRRFWIFNTDAPNGSRQQIVYRQRLAAGSYSPKQPVDAASGSWTAPMAVLGADNVTTHLIYKDQLGSQLRWRTLSLEGSLSEAVRIETSGTSKVFIPQTNPVVYQRDGAEVVMIAFADGGGVLRSVAITDGVVGAEEIVSPAPILQDPGITKNSGAVAHLTVLGSTVYAIWADLASGDLMMQSHPHGGSWSEPQRVWDSGANQAEWVYLQAYVRDKQRRIGFTYDVGPHPDDTGKIEFRELTLS